MEQTLTQGLSMGSSIGQVLIPQAPVHKMRIESGPPKAIISANGKPRTQP